MRRYSLRTEEAYTDWIKRYVRFHKMRSRPDLEEGTAKVAAFLTYLAIEGQVAAATQEAQGMAEPHDSALLAIRKPSQIPIPAETNEALVKSRTVLGRRSKTMSPTLYEPDALVMTVDRPRRNVRRSHVSRMDFWKNG